MEYLSSRDNPHIRTLSRLIKQKKQREKTGLFLVEGARLCADVAGSSVNIDKVFVTKEAREKYPEECNALLKKARISWEISEEAADWVSDTKNPQGIFAVGQQLDNSFSEDIISENGKYLLLDNIQDPGNVGTIIRTALSLGVTAVFISEDSAEIYSPKVLRASMGAVVKIPIVIADDIGESVQLLRNKGVTVYATALEEGARPVKQVDFTGASGLLVGNEGSGLSQSVIDRCNGSIKIPMAEGAESLNVSAATSIFLWEMVSGRIEEKE